MLATSRGLVSISQSVCLFVCPIGIHPATHQGAACDVASIHFGPTIGRTDMLAI